MTADGASRRTQAERVAEAERALLRAALELIAEQGYERTTAAAIGERAGYSRSMVRLRYGSKDRLLVSLLRRDYRERLVPDPPDGLTGLERALILVQQNRTHLAKFPGWLRAFHVLLFEAVTQLPVMAGWMPDWFGRHQRIVDDLAAGQRDGSVRTELDPEVEARRFIDHGTGIAFCWLVEGDDERYDAELCDWGDYFRRAWQVADR